MKIFFLVLSLILLAAQPARAAGSEGIAIVINNEAISNSDVDDRMKLIAASTGIAKNPDLMAKLRPQIVDMLIDETLKLQEAKRLKISVSKAEIDSGFNEIANNNKIPPDKFHEMIEKSGININTMNDQIKAQLAWGKVVQAKIRPKIEVTDNDIDAELVKLKRKIGENEYHLAQIYLPINETAKEGNVATFAAKLDAQLKQQPDAFPKAAQQFSQAPGAKQGGDMGWIEKGQLPEEVDAVLDTLQPGQISDPIKSQNAYYLIFMVKQRQMTEDLLPKREDLTQKIGIQRMERASRRYMLDLRSTAFIETRG